MKKVYLSLAACLGLIALLMAGCTYIIGAGNTVNKEYDFQGFNKIEVGSAFHFDITKSDSYSVTVTTRENIVDHLDVVQSGKTVKIRLKPGSYSNSDTRVSMTLPDLQGLVISGASQGTVKGFKSSNDLDMKVSGASKVEIQAEAGNSTLEVSGASKVTGSLVALDADLTASGASHCDISGSANNARFNVSGASSITASSFSVQSADVDSSGASKATINTNGKLEVDATGASTVEYTGNPTLGKVNVNGASNLAHK